MSIKASDTVRLPIGLRYNGVVYRDVVIDEMTGVDEENMSSPKIKNNGARALTILLQRCVQEIPGLVERKRRPQDLLDAKYFMDMYTPDRDYLFMAIRSLGLEDNFTQVVTCPKCDNQEDITVCIPEIGVLDWDDSPAELEYSLPQGLEIEGKIYKDVVWTFLTGSVQEQLVSLSRDKIMTATMAACIKSVKGLDYRLDTDIIRRMRSRDRMALLNFVKLHTPGLELTRNQDCPSCNHTWEETIDVNHFFQSGSAEIPKTTDDGKKPPLQRRKG